MTAIIVPILWLAIVGCILGATSPAVADYQALLFADWPDPADYPGFLGTDWLGYITDFLYSIATRIAAVFGLIGTFTVWPSFEYAGYTVDPSDFPPMVLIQGIPIVWILVASWERLPVVGSGG